VWESHVTWGTPVQSFVFLGLLVFELEPMYATSDRQTDGRTTDADDRLMPSPPLRGRGHNNPMKLKSRLRVTPGHWKRNQCIDHTRLTISRVIWRWILALPWNVGQRSLKVIENCTVWKIGYGFLFAFHSNYSRIAVSLAVSEIFCVKIWMAGP